MQCWRFTSAGTILFASTSPCASRLLWKPELQSMYGQLENYFPLVCKFSNHDRNTLKMPSLRLFPTGYYARIGPDLY